MYSDPLYKYKFEKRGGILFLLFGILTIKRGAEKQKSCNEEMNKEEKNGRGYLE